MRYAFANCLLDTESYQFRRDGTPVPLEPQVFDLLRYLAEHAGQVVTKDQLIDTIWGGRIVSEAAISARISAARAAVGDTGKAQGIIRTITRRGFELVAPVEVTGHPPASPAPASTSRQTIRYATSLDGSRIAWAVSGSGPPLLRAGHHVTHLERDWHSSIWRPEFDRLGAAHRLIRFDIRGSGLSDPLTPGSGIDTHVEDMAAVIDAAGLDQLAMIATLQNTPTAIRYIAENPGRVTRLVVQCGYVRGRARRETAYADPEADPSIALLREGWGDPDNGFMRAWLSMFMPGATREELTEFIELLGAASSPDHIAEQRRVVDGLYAEDCLDRVTIPTLVIHPRNCVAHPLAEGQLIARAIPGAELMVIESTNIACMPSEPAWEEQLSATLDFLARD
jgi:DNA-binding winged helix-turn-helix (wHTH) protein